MNRYVLIGVVAVVAALAGAGIAWWLQPAPEPARESASSGIPEFAPEFTLADLDGNPRDFSEWQGRTVVLNFWATWCAPCRREIPVLVELQAAHDPEELTVLGIAIDETDAVREYVGQIGMTYETLVGQLDAIEIAQTLGNHIGAMPYTVIVGPDGRVEWVHAGEVDAEMLATALTERSGSPP